MEAAADGVASSLPFAFWFLPPTALACSLPTPLPLQGPLPRYQGARRGSWWQGHGGPCPLGCGHDPRWLGNPPSPGLALQKNSRHCLGQRSAVHSPKSPAARVGLTPLVFPDLSLQRPGSSSEGHVGEQPQPSLWRCSSPAASAEAAKPESCHTPERTVSFAWTCSFLLNLCTNSGSVILLGFLPLC